MGKLRIALLMSVVVLLAAGGGLELGRFLRHRHRDEARPEEPACLLTVPTSALRMGEVWETDRFEWSLPITNDGDRTVEVKSFWTSCGCAKVTPPAVSIAAKQTVRVAFLLDLTTGAGHLPFHARAADRRWGAEIRPVLAEPEESKGPSWVLQGWVRPLIDKDALWVECGAYSVLDQPAFRGKLRVKARTPLDALGARCATPRLQARVERNAADPSLFDVEVTPAALLPVGQVSSELILTPHRAGKESLPEQRVPVSGRVVADVQAFPETILLGAVTVGRRVEQAAALHSLTGRPVAVKRVVAPEGVEVEPLETKGSSDGLHYRIRQTIGGAGSQTSRVRFVLAAAAGQGEQEAGLDILWHTVPGRGEALP